MKQAQAGEEREEVAAASKMGGKQGRGERARFLVLHALNMCYAESRLGEITYKPTEIAQLLAYPEGQTFCCGVGESFSPLHNPIHQRNESNVPKRTRDNVTS